MGGVSESDVTLSFLLFLCVVPLRSRPGRRGADRKRGSGAGSWLPNLSEGIYASRTWVNSASH